MSKTLKSKFSEEIKSITRNSGWLLLEKSWSLLIAVVVIVIVARYLGPSQYAVLSYCTSVMGILAGLTILGWDRLIIRDLSEAKFGFHNIMQSQLGLRFTGSIFAAVISFLIILYSRPNDTESLLIIILLSLSSVVSSMTALEVFFLANLESKKITPIRIAVPLISATLRVAIVIAGGTIVHLATVSLVESILVSCYMGWAYKKRTGKIAVPKLNSDYSKRILSLGWPLFLALQLDMLAQRVYGVLMGEFLSADQYGQFMLAIRLVEIPMMLIYVSTTSFMPQLTSLFRNDPTEYNRRIRLYTEVGTVLGVFSWVLVFLFGPRVVEILFSSEYSESGNYLIYMWGAVFVQANAMFRAHHLVLIDAQKTLLIGNAVGFLASVPIAILFLDTFGRQSIGLAFTASVLVTYYGSGLLTKGGREFMAIQTKALLITNILKSANHK